MSGKVLENNVVAIRNDKSYYCYDWIIKFSCLCDNCIRQYQYRGIISSYFTTKSLFSEVWYLELEIDRNADIFFKMMLYNVDNKCLTVPVSYESNADIYNCKLRISVRNKINIICYSTEYENLRALQVYDYPRQTYLKFKFIKLSSLRNCEYSLGGELTFVVEIFKPVNVISMDIKNTVINAEGKVLKNLQQDEKFSDVTLVAGEQEFRVHKVVLATQSPVFLAMFEHDMKEKVENKIIIEDISDETMKLVLDYMYTGSVDKDEKFKNLASDVLVAADKYALEDLVKICEEEIVQGLNNDNVFKVLQTANSYKLNSLKEVAVKFIAREIEDLMKTNDFSNLVNSSIDSLKEIILAVKNKDVLHD